MKKLAITAALSLAALSGAHASGIGGGGSFSATGYSGTITGNASSVSSGNAVAASQVNGHGFSTQTSFGNSHGSASVDGSFTPSGAEVNTHTSQFAYTDSYGHVGGNAPIEVNGSIANGTAGFAETTTSATSTTTFHKGTISGTGGFSAFGAFAHFNAFNH